MTTLINSAHAPAAVGPYSHACIHQGTLYVSGQIPLDTDGQLIAGDIAAQTRQCMRNIAAIAREAGTDLQQGLRFGIYLTDMANFSEVNNAYEAELAGHRPARSCIGVAALPKGARVEIDAVIALP